MHLPTEVAWHEYLLEIVAAGSKKLFMDFYINFGSLIQPIKISTANERRYQENFSKSFPNLYIVCASCLIDETTRLFKLTSHYVFMLLKSLRNKLEII